jgi:hypothetical protein
MVELRPTPGAAGTRWSPGWFWWWARHAVVFEVRLYRSLFRWVARRPDRGGESDEPFTYARMVTPVMWLWIFASACEIPLAHVLVPWESVRLALLVVGAWGLVWMIGLLASLWVYPHLLTTERLVVRNGAAHRIELPWEAIASLAVRTEDMASSVWTLQPVTGQHGTDLNVSTGAQVNVHAVLVGPTVVATAKGEMEIVELSFYADEPRALVASAQARLAGADDRRGP